MTEIKVNPILNKKVSLWHGDITRLEIDAIVSAAASGNVHKKMDHMDQCVLLYTRQLVLF